MRGNREQGSERNRRGSGGVEIIERTDGAYEFRDLTAAERYFAKNGNWINSLTSAEGIAIYDYTGNGYKDINKGLREDTVKASDNTEIGKMVRDMDSAIEKSVLNDAIVVNRLGYAEAFGIKGKVTNRKRKDLIGGEFIDKGYVSTSAGGKGVMGEIPMKIKVPPGKGRGGYIGVQSVHSSESEFLLKRSTKFRVTGVAQGKTGISYLEIEVID